MQTPPTSETLTSPAETEPAPEAVRCVVVYPHPDRPSALDVARDAAAAFERHGVKVCCAPTYAKLLAGQPGGDGYLASVEVLEVDRLRATCDLALSVGGDGTLLRMFQDVPELPLVGVNCGALGYLAVVAPDGLEEFVARAALKGLEVEDRVTIYARRPHAAEPLGIALNDIVVSKGKAGRVPRVDVVIDGELFATLLADAFIVATPTGSTAYNFSARGPIVSPAVDAYLLTPVAPHSLWDRPLVLAPDQLLELRAVGDRAAIVSVDGWVVADLAQGESVRIGVGATRARLVRFGTDSFSGRIRRTFGVGTDRLR